MAAHVLAVRFDLHIPSSRSLKEKRSVITSVREGARRRFSVAVAETDHQDQLQRAELTVACVASSAGQADEIADAVERFVWSFPELDVLDGHRDWMEIG